MDNNNPALSVPMTLTLRDWFAGQALCGIIASRFSAANEATIRVDKNLTSAAYFYADTMLAARLREPGNLE